MLSGSSQEERERMKVWVKSFDVAMELKNKGIELDIYNEDGTEHLGDLIVTKTKLIWCKGKTHRKNGKVFWLTDFIKYAEENLKK
jgi:hypothetical protein